MLELEHKLFQLPFFFIILNFKAYEIELKVTEWQLRYPLQLPLGFVQQNLYAMPFGTLRIALVRWQTFEKH